MNKRVQLTEKDKERYRNDIKVIDLSIKDKVLSESTVKLNTLMKIKTSDPYRIAVIQEIYALNNILRSTPNLETSIQQKILFALQYFAQGTDEIPDNIPGIGFLDDAAVIDWIIEDIKEQYSQYYSA